MDIIMGTSPEYKQFCLDLLEPLYPIYTRRMFSSVGIFIEEGMFAIISSDDQLYFKVDETNRDDYVSEEMPQFMNLPYYLVPPDVLESQDELRIWMMKSVGIAKRNPRKNK